MRCSIGKRSRGFQSPEGDSGLCYTADIPPTGRRVHVSVPRRGFRSLLLGAQGPEPTYGSGFSPPKGIQVFVTHHSAPPDRDNTKFQSPEGDSGLCYAR